MPWDGVIEQRSSSPRSENSTEIPDLIVALHRKKSGYIGLAHKSSTAKEETHPEATSCGAAVMVAVNVKHGVVPRTPVKLSPITGVVGVSTLCIVMTPGPKSV